MSKDFSLLTSYWHSTNGYLPGFLEPSLAKSSRLKILSIPSSFYIWFIKGTPTSIQVFIVYPGSAQLGVEFSPFVRIAENSALEPRALDIATPSCLSKSLASNGRGGVEKGDSVTSSARSWKKAG